MHGEREGPHRGRGQKREARRQKTNRPHCQHWRPCSAAVNAMATQTYTPPSFSEYLIPSVSMVKVRGEDW